MASLLLTYSGVADGQRLVFKPTLLAALLASGVGTYLYQEQPEGRPQQQSLAGRTDQTSDYNASFYGAARAAESQVQVSFVPAEAKTGLDFNGLSLATNDFGHAVFVAAPQLEARSHAPAMIRPQLDSAGPGLDRDPVGTLPKPEDEALDAIFSQWGAARPEAPIELAATAVASQPDLEPAKVTSESGVARLAASEPLQTPSVSALADAAPGVQTGSLLDGVALETVTEAALANFSQPLVTAPAQSAIAVTPLAAAPPMPASAELVTKPDTGVAAPVSDPQLAIRPAALAPAALATTAQAQQQPRTELVAAVAPAVREAPTAAVEPAVKPAPLVLQPIKFKLQPTAKSAAPSAGLAAAKRSERAGQAVKLAPNGPASRKQTRLPDRLVGEFILHQVSVRLNDSPAGNIDVRIGGDASLSIRVGALLSVVEGRLDPELFAVLSKSAGADAYVSFRELRAAGIDVRYEPAGETIVLTAE